MKRTIFYLGILIAYLCSMPAAAKFQINEIMQANINSLYVDNEYPDTWVELYNSGSTNFRMVGYRIGETENYDEAAVITGGTVIRAGEYVMLYCDKTGPSGYHVNLRLDSGKGTLYLFNNKGEIEDKLTYKKSLAPNVSYGRVSEDSDNWAFMKTPTPGGPNDSEAYTQVLPDPVFSHEGFVHTGGGGVFTLRVSVPEDVELPADTRLYYTTDGSEPTTQSASVEKQYRVMVASTTVVRARLISAEAASPMPVTQSYIYHPRDLDLPVISINTDSKYFYDKYLGIFAGENYKQDWRRPINIEYFTRHDDIADINQMGECRVHGAYTRVMPQKSMAVYTQKRFGNKRFDFPFWEAKPHVESVKSFVLRNGGNCFDGNRIADQAGQTLFGRNVPNLDYMENTEVVAYINGKYAGIYDLRERSNEDNIESNYDGLEDIDMVENYTELKEGSMQSFNDLVTLYNSNPTYEQLDSVIDIDNFAKTIIAQAYVTNTDWPGNNMVMWRPAAEGGKWRMLMKDMDFYAANGYTSTFFGHLLRNGGHENDTGEGNRPDRVKVFQTLWSHPEFREKIIDNYTVNLGDFLRKNLVREHIEKIRDQIDSEYYYHLQVYSNPLNLDRWKQSVEGLIGWSEARSDYLRDYLIHDYFDLGSKIPVSIVTNGCQVTMQDVPLTQEEFIGYYYQGRTLRVNTSSNGWKVILNMFNGAQRTLSINKKTYELPITTAYKSIQLEVDTQLDAVDEVQVRNIAITCVAGNVVVESASPLTDVTVTDVLGRTVAHLNGGMLQTELQLPEHGIYIVTARNSSGATVSKKVKG